MNHATEIDDAILCPENIFVVCRSACGDKADVPAALGCEQRDVWIFAHVLVVESIEGDKRIVLRMKDKSRNADICNERERA